MARRKRSIFRITLLLAILGVLCLFSFRYWQKQQPGYYWQQAQAANLRGDSEHEEFYLQQLTRMQPENAEVHVALADLYGADKRKPESAVTVARLARSLDHLRTATELRPQDVELRIRLMRAYLQAGRQPAAVEVARQVVALGSRDEGVLDLLAAAALGSNDPEEAAAALKLASKDRLQNSFVYLALQNRVYRAESEQRKLQKLFVATLDRVSGNTPIGLSSIPSADRFALQELLLGAVDRSRTLDEMHERLRMAITVFERLALVETTEPLQLASAEWLARLMHTAQQRYPLRPDATQSQKEDRLALHRRFGMLVEPALDSLQASPQVYREAGRAAFDAGADMAVIEITQQALKAHPKASPEVVSELLQIQAAGVQRLILLGRHAEAAPYIDDLLNDDKTVIWAHFAEATVAEKEGRLKDAERAYAQARYLAGDNVPVNTSLMNLLFRLGRYDEVVPLLEELEAHWSSLTLDEYEWIQRRLGGRDGLRLAQLQTYLAVGRVDDALALHAPLQGTSREPACIEALVRHYWKKKQKQQAMELLKQGRQKFPDNAQLLLCAAELDHDERGPDQALAIIRDGLVRTPADTKLRAAEVSLLCEQKQWSEAHDAAQKLFGEQSDASTSLWLARLFYRSQWLAAARHWADLSLKATSKPQQLAARLVLAEVCRTEGQAAGSLKLLTEARDHYRAILMEQPGNLAVANNLAWVCAVELHQPDQALDVVRNVRKHARTERLPPDVLDTFVRVYRESGQLDEARALLESSLKTAADSSVLRFQLGQLQAQAGEIDAARGSLDLALSLGLSGADAKTARDLLDRLNEKSP